MLDLVAGAGQRAVALALDIGLFEALAEGPATAADLAGPLDCDPDGLRPMLGFLAALGYVTRDGDRFSNTAMTEAWLREEPGSVASWLTFWAEVVFPFWDAHLESSVRTGGPPLTLYEWLDDHPEYWQTAHEGFGAVAEVVAPTVVDDLALTADARVLDVGGGHGRYAAELAARHPDVRVTVLDTKPARDVAEDTAARHGVADRVSFRVADYESDSLGEGYDVALLFNVVHAHDGSENTALFERVRQALAPGGRLYVLDQFEGTGRTSLARATIGFVDLTYLVTLGQRAHDEADVRAWLADAGFAVRDRTSFLTAPGLSLLAAERPN